MKIGILTYHKSNNFGALLQAIALRSVLENAGHQATFIDYWPGYHRRMYDNFSFLYFLRKKGVKARFKYLKECLIPYQYRKKRKENFDCFIHQYVEPYLSSMQESYDVVVHGSDQIWRKQPEMHIYNPVYFGKHSIQAQRKISYAASMGILPECEKDKNIVKEYLVSLDCISVRESSLLDLVHSFGYEDARLDLDPTLLLPSSFWVDTFHLSQEKEKYALYYCLQNSFDIAELRKFVHSKGLKLKIIYSKAVGKDTDGQYTTSGPEDFLNLIYGADFVFTSSFHGLAFALIFQKPFYASYRKNSGRAASLLQSLGLSDRMIVPRTPIPEEQIPINYGTVNSMMQEMRNSSLQNLECMLSCSSI